MPDSLVIYPFPLCIFLVWCDRDCACYGVFVALDQAIPVMSMTPISSTMPVRILAFVLFISYSFQYFCEKFYTLLQRQPITFVFLNPLEKIHPFDYIQDYFSIGFSFFLVTINRSASKVRLAKRLHPMLPLTVLSGRKQR